MRSLLVLALIVFLFGFGCLIPGMCGGAVCGSDWQTYGDKCQAEAAGVTVLKDGQCGQKCTDSDGGDSPIVFGTAQYKGLSYNDYCQGSKIVEYSCRNNELQSQTSDCPSGTCENGACSTASCTDSDGGKDQYTKGTASEGTNYTDSCVALNKVQEYYCSTNGVLSEIITCSSGFECSDGACLSLTCSDTETGHGEYVAGTVTKGSMDYTDYCIDTTQINEFYCNNGVVVSATLTCPSGYNCDSGTCVSVGCSDDDGGSNKYSKGTTTKGDTTYTDYCTSSSEVKEYYCSWGDIYSSTLSCSSGYSCSDGACISGDSCDDSDGGKDRYEEGTTTKGEDEYTDTCKDSDTVKEYFCDNDDLIDYTNLDCPSGYECDDGECVVTGGTPTSCSDTDGQDYETVGSTSDSTGASGTDNCIDDTHVREYFCDNNLLDSESYDCSADSAVCDGGRCVPISCTDTDGGETYFTFGTVTFSYDGVDTDYDDVCTGPLTLREYYCDEYDVMNSTQSCLFGCSGGECQSISIPTCSDTDGGDMPYTFGTTTYSYGGSDTDYDDVCISPATVREYYCNGFMVMNTTHTCINLCTGGKCNPLVIP
ncbi:MAG: hypothetical protein ABH842_03635 [Candidatus Micrarchaeota archaeon]